MGQPPLGRNFLLDMNLFQNNIHGWLVFPSCMILVFTIERPFAHIKKLHWTTPFMQKFSFGHEPFSKQCSWFTSFPFACDISAYSWITFCTHKKVTMDSPFMQKIFYSSMQKIHICRKFFYAENSSLVENSSVQKILLCRKFFYFHAEKSLLCRKISLLGPKSFSLIFSKNTDYYSNNVKLDNVYWVQNLLHGEVF